VTAILGLNAYHGDAAACLVIDGHLVNAAEEERFNRIKHCAGFPTLAAEWCLADAGLAAADLDYVAVGRDPKAHILRRTSWTLVHGIRPGFIRHRLGYLGRISSIRDELEDALSLERGTLRAEVHHVEHHQAHAASAFFVSPFEHAAILSVDGFGDFTSTLLAEGQGSKLHVLDRVPFPHSLGAFYTAITQWLGFLKYGDEGKIMGLAPYGRPLHLERMRELVRLDGDLFRLGLDYFAHQRGIELTWNTGTPTYGLHYSERLVDTFGPAREPGGEITSAHEDVAASLQAMLEEAYLHVLETLWKRTQSPNLCLAGGVALNAVANGLVRQRTPFRELFVQPAAGDSGTAVGAAYYVWNQKLGRERGEVMNHAYTGPQYSGEECAQAARRAGLRPQRVEDDELFPLTAEAIADGQVVGWFQGRMEFGPRALGARSIVVDPRRPDMKDILNARIKHREPFRPFAPSILAEATGEWFEQDYPSPFMVLVYKTRPERRASIPAVNHVDDTGRLQTVERDIAPRYWRLIKEFERLTSVPVVLNTSFNENEPIVMSPEQALDCFKRTRMDLLVLENQVIRRS
jgi:carbamoyltransferase